MDIQYRWCKDFDTQILQKLFQSVGWSSGNYPAELRQAMLGSDSVVSAWRGSELVGLMNALSDGAMTVYFHFLVVHPEVQGMGVGRSLVESMLARYQGLYRKVLNSYDEAVGFYTKCGFQINEGITSVGITSWNT